ncbi:MAG: hypothetical protein LBR88_05780 [Zoogloeaceae bacterium]|nr:hypothetical protein [Zoogloeaceae bacterium]
MAHDPLQDDKATWGKNPFAAPETEIEEVRGETGKDVLLTNPNRLAAWRDIFVSPR